MNRTKEEIGDRKFIANRLKRIDKKKWQSLTDQQREDVVEKYLDAIDPKKLDVKILIEEAWSRAYAMEVTVFGVLLGMIGGAAGAVIDRYFAPFGLAYGYAVLLLFLVMLVLGSRLPEMMKVRDLRDGRLFQKLLGEEEV